MSERDRLRIGRARRSMEALEGALESLLAEAPKEVGRHAAARGFFTPDESDTLREWFARYLTVRAALHETLADLRPIALRGHRSERDDERRALLYAFSAACLLVRGARTLIWEVAAEGIVRRKLDESAAAHRIGEGTFTRIYGALLDPSTESALIEGRAAIRAEQAEMLAVAGTEAIDMAERLAEAIEVPRADLDQARRTHRRFRLYRIGRSIASAALFALAERSGRIIAEFRWPWHRDRVGRITRRRLGHLLAPGDVLITRHARALSNLLLPGYWPHAALYVGDRAQAERLKVPVARETMRRWGDDDVVLEARKDGVRLRPLADTLAVDAVVLLRPMLSESDMPRMLERALRHEGKPYNFDFDFFTDDRLVCTEVVYRAMQGLSGIDFPLTHRYGRPTLSAEDLISLALDRQGLSVRAVFGVPGARWTIARNERAEDALRRLRGGANVLRERSIEE